ncbi:hypothetical protein AB0A05_27255 [Streptomyces sp. NPDC046374]|uniref:hypothetical protein n=1 Tax=Streptomyces sp. NPDC046374 TaxID=3154917 RepID=UPI0033EA0416
MASRELEQATDLATPEEARSFLQFCMAPRFGGNRSVRQVAEVLPPYTRNKVHGHAPHLTPLWAAVEAGKKQAEDAMEEYTVALRGWISGEPDPDPHETVRGLLQDPKQLRKILAGLGPQALGEVFSEAQEEAEKQAHEALAAWAKEFSPGAAFVQFTAGDEGAGPYWDSHRVVFLDNGMKSIGMTSGERDEVQTPLNVLTLVAEPAREGSTFEIELSS